MQYLFQTKTRNPSYFLYISLKDSQNTSLMDIIKQFTLKSIVIQTRENIVCAMLGNQKYNLNTHSQSKKCCYIFCKRGRNKALLAKVQITL